MPAKTILITRQPEFCQDLANDISQAGFIPETLPLFEIKNSFDSNYLKKIIDNLESFKTAVAISKNSFMNLLPFLELLKAHDKITWATVGPGTADYLQQHGLTNVIYPKQKPYNSSSLLKILREHNLQDLPTIIFTGEEGLSNLEQNLKSAKVIELYQRQIPSWGNKEIQRVKNSDIILITCITSLYNLISLTKNTNYFIFEHPLLVISQRIYTEAIKQGFTKVYFANSMQNQDIIEGLRTWLNA